MPRRVEGGGELAWVCRRQEIRGSSICWAVPCVVWCYALSLRSTLCHMAVPLVVQLYTMSFGPMVVVWPMIVVWSAVLSFGCWVVVWPAFGDSRCCLGRCCGRWVERWSVGLRNEGKKSTAWPISWVPSLAPPSSPSTGPHPSGEGRGT